MSKYTLFDKNCFIHIYIQSTSGLSTNKVRLYLKDCWMSLTLCGLTSQKTHQGGLGLSGPVHEEAHPGFPYLVQPSFKGTDAGSIYHPLVQLIYSYSKASTQLHKQRHKTNSRVECQANTQSIKQKPTWNHNLVTHILLTYTDIIKANVSIRKAILTNYSLHIWKYRKNNMLTLVHTLTTLSDSNDY